ncbi:MAG TPA: right-handed parallel beta-helix repeat-containing protein [Sphingobacteriaceae bacterium]|nr:right-handed parallel beta-helix repeat-containing protein [Sphingobacteriaceae bacterium]
MFRIIITLLFILIFSLANAQETFNITIAKSSAKDDTKVFQTALNEKRGSALKITVRKGVYKLNGGLSTARANTSITFEKGAVIYFSSNISAGISVQHNGFSLENAHIKGNSVSAKDFYTGYGVLLNGVSGCVIKNSAFEGISGNNILFYPKSNTIGCSDNLILNNSFIKPAFDLGGSGDESAIMLGYSGEGYQHNNNVIKGNVIDGGFKLKIGIGMISHGQNNLFENNTVNNCRHYGIMIYESKDKDTTLYNNIIKDNTIRNIGEVGSKKTVKGMGIYLMKSSNSSVKGNRVYNTLINSDETETLGAGAISISLSPDTRIDSNFIDGSYMYGIVSDYSFGSKFSDNVIQNTRKSGAYFINMNNVVVSGNTFRNIGAVAIKGYFENTSLPYIQEQMRIDTYKNINTGNNFRITRNKFYTDKEILYFTGTEKDKRGHYENKIRNNTVGKNKIFGNTKKLEELINFRQEVAGSNRIYDNTSSN